MSKKKATPAPAAPATVSTSGDDALAFHLSEVLRLARNRDLVPEGFYNAVGDAAKEHIVNEATRECDLFKFLRFALTRIAARGKGDEAAA